MPALGCPVEDADDGEPCWIVYDFIQITKGVHHTDHKHKQLKGVDGDRSDHAVRYSPSRSLDLIA